MPAYLWTTLYIILYNYNTYYQQLLNIVWLYTLSGVCVSPLYWQLTIICTYFIVNNARIVWSFIIMLLNHFEDQHLRWSRNHTGFLHQNIRWVVKQQHNFSSYHHNIHKTNCSFTDALMSCVWQCRATDVCKCIGLTFLTTLIFYNT